MSTTELDTIVTVPSTESKVPSASGTIEALEAQVGGVSYNPISWMDGGKPPISAKNLQRFETGLTTIIGNSNNGKKNGLIDMITATLREEIDDRINDITKIHERIDDGEKNIDTALQTESEARSDADNNLNARIDKFVLPPAPPYARDEEGYLQIIKTIEIHPDRQNEFGKYVTVETGRIGLEEIDIPDISTNKVYVDKDKKTGLTSKLTDLDERIDEFKLDQVTFNHKDPADEGKLQVIKSIAINPAAEGSYVTVEKDSIALSEVDIPEISTNKVYVDTNKTTILTSKLEELDSSDRALGARISKLTTTKVSVNDPNLSKDGSCEVISSFEIANDTVTIETAPIVLTNKDIPENISSDKIDVTVSTETPKPQTLTAELAKLNQSDSNILAYIDEQLERVTKGTMYWKTY